jgi:two-component system sensor histidine kinase KdpD
MSSDRPNPDELLARVQAEEVAARRGKLKIFFGYAAGVGKTYAMLEAARREREVVIYVRETAGPVTLRYGQDTDLGRHERSELVAQWVADRDQMAGLGTDTLPNALGMFAPLIGSQRTVGAVGVRPKDTQRLFDPDQQHLLETCASMIALSCERDVSVLEAHEARLRVETEQLRNSLLSSVSHDLRTPLATIADVSSSLLEPGAEHDDAARRELLQSLFEETRRLSRLVDNLLDMSRLQSGATVLNRQWHVLEEIIGSATVRLRRELAHHRLGVDLPADLPLLFLDGVLLEQVFVNLLENAVRYTPAGSQIEVSARQEGRRVETRVADNGPGLPPGSESQVFEKFYRAATTTADGRRGVGLGLSICQGIVQAHGGSTSARNRAGGGAEFVLSLPCEKPPPRVILDEVPAKGGV